MARDDDGKRDAEKIEEDRQRALAWYLRKLLIQEQDRGIRMAWIARKTGVQKPQLSYIINDARSAGPKTLIRLSEYFRRDPGELLDEAYEWWERMGRAEAAAIKVRRGADAEAQVEAHVRDSNRGSGLRGAVRIGMLPEGSSRESPSGTHSLPPKKK